ncbi:hypothetical protein ALC57_01070, partial [Trachymyrmex cornetzi]
LVCSEKSSQISVDETLLKDLVHENPRRRTSQGGQHQLEQSTSFSLYRQIRTSLKRGSLNHVVIMRNMQRALNIRRAS